MYIYFLHQLVIVLSLLLLVFVPYTRSFYLSAEINTSYYTAYNFDSRI